MLFSYSKSINLPYSKLSEKLSKNNQNQTDSQVLGSISKFLPKVFKLLGFSIFAFVIFSLSDQNGIKVFAENPEINVQIQNETPDSQSNSQAGNNLITNVKKTQKYNSEIQEMLDLINQERIKNGTGILKTQKNLVRASDYFADYLATRDLDGSFFDHTEKSGRGPWERCRDFEYPITCGENLAAGQLQVQTAFGDLMKSSSHRKNILNPKYCQIGISKSENPKSYYGIYWVQNFGRNCE